jgi:glycosyltransferase involved in cell wall biosynthesis
MPEREPPIVSVIIPSYNHAAYLARAVQSVLTQECGAGNAKGSGLELIVVDDGSQDESLVILAGINDRRLRVIAQENQGAHAAINRGLREAKGETLAILNSDDEYHPQRLQKILFEIQTAAHPGLVATYIELIDAENHSLGVKHGYQDQVPWILESPERSYRAGNDRAAGSLAAALLTENYLGSSSNFVFTRACYQAVGEFRPLHYMHDWDFALRAARVTPLSLLPEPLLRYRMHAQNTIRQDQAAMVFELCWILAVHLPNAFAPGHAPEVEFLERMLNSIYTYGCDRILNVLLAQSLYMDIPRALALLDPGHPERAVYMEHIQQQLAKANGIDANSLTTRQFLLSRIRRRWDALKVRFSR